MKKIMFNDQYRLTEAVLEGRKTMTRRIEKGLENFENGVLIKPRYQLGEIVAISQSYGHIFCVEPSERLTEEFSSRFVKQKGLSETKGWKNKMFVKAELMPHHIRIIGIKVERLQDISAEDCLSEGIAQTPVVSGHPTYSYCGFEFDKPQQAFAELINDVSGKGTWERNPFVVAYEFELID